MRLEWNVFFCVRACVCVRVSSGEGKKEKEKGGRCPPLTCTSSSSFPFSSSSSRLRRRNRQRAQVCLSAFVCVRDTPAADVDLLLPAIYFNFFLFFFRGSFNLKAFLISFFLDLLHDCPQPVNQLRNFCFLFVFFWVKKTKKKNEEGGREEKDKKMDTLLIFVVAIVARGIDILWPLIDVGVCGALFLFFEFLSF